MLSAIDNNCMLIEVRMVLYGEPLSGKSTFMNRCQQDVPLGKIPPTVGIDYVHSIIEYEDQMKVGLYVWDTSGKAHLADLAHAYFRTSDMICVFYQVTDLTSRVEESLVRFREAVGLHTSHEKKPFLLLIANKIDLLRSQEESDAKRAKGKELASRFGFNAFMFVSLLHDDEALWKQALFECVFRSLIFRVRQNATKHRSKATPLPTQREDDKTTRVSFQHHASQQNDPAEVRNCSACCLQ